MKFALAWLLAAYRQRRVIKEATGREKAYVNDRKGFRHPFH